MIYYFVDWDGYITTEDAEKDWFAPDQSTFTRKVDAIAEAKRRIKVRIGELEDYRDEISAKGWKP